MAAERDAIYEEVMTKGWNAKLKAFTQYYGARIWSFAPHHAARIFHGADRSAHDRNAGSDPARSARWRTGQRRPGLPLSALAAHRRPAGRGGHIQYVLVLAGGGADPRRRTDPAKLEQARIIFERMLGYANHLGLYAEQTSAQGEALGNFPQAFTHLSLISSAFNLDRTLGGCTLAGSVSSGNFRRWNQPSF